MSGVLAQHFVQRTTVLSAVVGAAVELQAIHKDQFVRSAEAHRSAEKLAERQELQEKREAVSLQLSSQAKQIAQGVSSVASASESGASPSSTVGNIDILA